MAGLAFPTLLVFVQLGLQDAALRNATLVYDALAFDVALVSPHYVALMKAGQFPRRRLFQALSVADVEGAAPVYVGLQPWRHAITGTRRDVLVLGSDPRRPPFRSEALAELARAVERPDTALVDRLTRPEYGPRAPGAYVDVGGHRVEIAGEFTMGAGFAADGVVITSDSTWARLLRSSVDQVSIGLLRLRAGGDAERVAQELNARLPRDVRAWPRRALEASERDYWATTAAIGIIFGAGVIVGFAVLIVIVYQIVSSDVTRRTREYATMKALGYHHRALVRVGVEQALILVGAAFVAGLALALLVYTALAGATNLPIQMTLPRVVGVLVAAVGLSAAASLVALRRVRAADPADLF